MGQEKSRVQISHIQFASFNYPNNGIEEQIYKILCHEYEKLEDKEQITPISTAFVSDMLHKNLSPEKIKKGLQKKFSPEEITEGLENLKMGKGEHCIITMNEAKTEIMPGPCFGILR